MKLPWTKEPRKPENAESADEALLRHIRERYAYLEGCWAEAREERRKNLRFLMGDPWDPEDRKEREEAGRPCISHDELQQYINQAINIIRQNKRGIKVDPEDEGADDKTAELRQNIIRTIEYRCATQNDDITAFENAIYGGYGFEKIDHQYKGKTFDQEIVTKAVTNPDTVLYDWDCKEPDWSDGKDYFEIQYFDYDEFERRFGKTASKKSFSDFAEDRRNFTSWIGENRIRVVAYWRLESTFKTLYQLADGSVVEDPPEGVEPVNQREYEEKKLVKYITNGVEILKREEHPGDMLNMIPCLGKELWYDDGSGPQRKLLGLINLARDPQMSLAYLCSQEMEEAGLSPRTSWVGAVGQFETDREAWETSHKQPHPMLQYDIVVDEATQTVLPPPQRGQFTPNFAAFEIAKDACRRAIQAAMGISPLPTAAQRNNEKSGVALERIQQMQQVGSFHFVDNYDRFLRLRGRVINAWIPIIYDTERTINLRKPDDSYQPVRLNAPQGDENGNVIELRTDRGEHHVTVSTGPSYQSQMDEVSQFLDNLIANLRVLPISPQQQAKLLAIAIRMKQMGPKGDEMADIISPPEDAEQQIPPQVQEAIAQLQQQLQALNEYAKQKEQELQDLQAKIDARVVDNEYKKEIEKLKIQRDLAIEEMKAESQQMVARLNALESLVEQLQGQQHESGMQRGRQEHEAMIAEQQAMQAAAQQGATEQV